MELKRLTAAFLRVEDVAPATKPELPLVRRNGRERDLVKLDQTGARAKPPTGRDSIGEMRRMRNSA